MAAVIGLARAFPWIGCTGGPLKPELTLNKLSIAVVFTLSGLNTSFRELTAAVARWRLNACIQAFTFIVFPSVMFFCLCPMLQLVLPASAIDGLITLACLPSTINMCILMSQAAGADVTCALFNAVCGNLLGVFLTPALIFAFVGRSLHVSFVEAIGKLSRMVLLPLLFGQLLRRTSVLTFAQKHKGSLKIVNEFALLGIVFTTFCDTFIKGERLCRTLCGVQLCSVVLCHINACIRVYEYAINPS
jgi:sodium/bile acid cotransporter 7